MFGSFNFNEVIICCEKETNVELLNKDGAISLFFVRLLRIEPTEAFQFT